MRRIISTIAASAIAASGLVATTTLTAAPAEAANRSTCVTAWEHSKIKPGKSKTSMIKLLDWKGKRVSSRVREYKRCTTGQKIRVTYDRPFYKKRAKVKRVSPKWVAPKPPVVVKPPIKPPVKPPVKPPAQVPTYPDVTIDSVTQTSITIKWTRPANAYPAVTGYQFGGSNRAGIKLPVTTQASSAASGTYTFEGLKPSTEYKVWAKAKNSVGYGEEQWSNWTTTAQGDAGPAPDPITEKREFVDEATCETLTVKVLNQTRTGTYSWDGAEWVVEWGEWTTTSTTTRAATADDCVNVVSTLSDDVLLPDLRPKNLNKCGKGDMDATGGDCFLIVPSAPHNHDFPALEGKKLLKFPVLTMNAGDGPAEVIADRTSSTQSDWRAYQTFVRPNGDRESQVAQGVEFYFAGDGHNHWHFTDFDFYWIEDLDGKRLREAEKHGYCLEDNTTLSGFPGAPANPVYANATTCGNGLPSALTIIEGLSKGWGDTYPTTLPDQAIDITDLPDGTYWVGVSVDWIGAVKESDEDNNTAKMQITISGNTVTTHPETAVGGLA